MCICIYHHTPSGQSRLYRVTQLRTDGVHCRESVVSKYNQRCTAAVHTVDPFFPPDIFLYKRRKFSVCGTIFIICCVSKHTGSYYCCTVDPFSPSRLMPAQTSVKSEMNTVQYYPLCPNIVTAVLLLYILSTVFYPPRLMPVNV